MSLAAGSWISCTFEGRPEDHTDPTHGKADAELPELPRTIQLVMSTSH